MGVLPTNTKVSRGCEKVYQCLPSSFSGAPLFESTADVHFVGLLPPCHTSSNWETVPQGGFLTDLTELNLSGWADLVQDVVAGLQALPPRLCLDFGTQVIALLQLLEAATGVGLCHHCCHPRPHCMCTGASQLAPPTSWSQIVQQAQRYGVTSSSSGVTDLSTPMGGMPGYVVPPPGLTPPDFSMWSIPPGLPISPLYQPPMGRASSLRATIDKQAQALRATVPQAPTSQAPPPQAPQMAPATPILRESAGNPIPAGSAAAK